MREKRTKNEVYETNMDYKLDYDIKIKKNKILLKTLNVQRIIKML